MRFAQLLTPVLALALTLGFACSEDKDDPTGPTGPEYRAPSSPENVLFNFGLAHQERDIDGYRASIDEDVYEFRSSSDAPLTFDEDLATTTNMFDEVLNIAIRLNHSGAVPSDLIDEFPSEDGYMMIQVPALFLEVRTNRDSGAGPITYSVPGDLARFMFREESAGTWKIVMIEDLAASPGYAAAPLSL